MRRRPPLNTWRVFGAPILIAMVSLVGLVAALLGDGLPDWISWATLSVPLIVIAWAVKARRT